MIQQKVNFFCFLAYIVSNSDRQAKCARSVSFATEEQTNTTFIEFLWHQ